MTKEEIKKRYKEIVLPENKTPYHFEKKEDANIKLMAYNPMCGDKYQLYLQEYHGDINEVHFHGIGCAISKASTSILLRKIEGMQKDDIEVYCKKFIIALNSEGDVSDLEDEELRVLAELKNFDGRLDCIQLSWKALLEYLTKE